MSERMKRLVSAYGPLALGFHVTTEVVVCGLFYLAVDHGLDVGALLRVVESMTGTDMSTVVSSGAGTLGVAYALTVALTGIPRTFPDDRGDAVHRAEARLAAQESVIVVV